MRVKLLLFTFYLHGRLHAVSVGKQSERMSKFWTVRFLKTESEQNVGFPHIPNNQYWFYFHKTFLFTIQTLHAYLNAHGGQFEHLL